MFNTFFRQTWINLTFSIMVFKFTGMFAVSILKFCWNCCFSPSNNGMPNLSNVAHTMLVENEFRFWIMERCHQIWKSLFRYKMLIVYLFKNYNRLEKVLYTKRKWACPKVTLLRWKLIFSYFSRFSLLWRHKSES